jgi:hypothetical protein
LRPIARVLVCVSILVGGAACTGKTARLGSSSTVGASTRPATTGCGQAQTAGAPSWVGTSGPKGLPFVLGQGGDALGYLFANPLRAGHPTDPANKILWVVRFPRDRQPLQLAAQPVGASGPAVSYSEPADSGPGEIYPSIIDVPTARCWHFVLTWAGHNDELDLRYAPPTT